MTEEMITSYLRTVDTLLRGTSSERQLVLDELEGDLHDAIAHYEREGRTREDAVAKALEDFGAPETIAAGLNEAPTPTPATRGRRRWLPLVLPAANLLLLIAVAIGSISMLQDGATKGESVYFNFLGTRFVIGGLLAAGAYAAIVRADRDPRWRTVGWACNVLILLPILAVLI